VFGFVDNSRPNGSSELAAYVWHEFEGARGMNVIGSCLLHDFRNRGFLRGEKRNELIIIADNCGGKNKNKAVIRFCLWLVEAGLFKTVRLLF
jgi:hypothetical protein